MSKIQGDLWILSPSGKKKVQDVTQSEANPNPPRLLNRRSFLSRSGGAAAAVTAAAIGLEPLIDGIRSTARAAEVGPLDGTERRQRMYEIREAAAAFQRGLPVVAHPDNNDEALYSTKIGNYSKGLPHNSRGEVDPGAYSSLLNALTSGNPADFESIILGCPNAARQQLLVNPQAGLAFDLEGTDSHQFAILPAPAFASAENAGEMVELYWMAMLRDVPFNEYDESQLTDAASEDLSALSDFRGPKRGGRVRPSTLFRGFTPGDLKGPYISQFLWLGTPFGAEFVERRMRTVLPARDYLADYSEWLEIQNGCAPHRGGQFDPVRRYIRNGRDLAQWVHIDVLFQAYFDAALILLTPPDPDDDETGGGMGCPLNPGNPYNGSQTQIGFGTFGGPYIATILCEVATRALKAIWFQKWFIHRRIRPEAFGGNIHNHLTRQGSYPIHNDLLNSRVVRRFQRQQNTYLLPQAFPEGSPLHPSYGAGHATVAGACVTILKALFDERFEIPRPVMPTQDGRRLTRYRGPDADRLTVGGELNKLAANVATGRNFAGIHWRSDYTQSVLLGEAVAISVLRDQRATYKEDFAGFTFTKFDGTSITV